MKTVEDHIYVAKIQDGRQQNDVITFIISAYRVGRYKHKSLFIIQLAPIEKHSQLYIFVFLYGNAIFILELEPQVSHGDYGACLVHPCAFACKSFNCSLISERQQKIVCVDGEEKPGPKWPRPNTSHGVIASFPFS